MKKLTIILLSFSIISCKPTEKTVIGIYDRYWDFEHSNTIQLNPDKTFLFKGQEGLMFWKTKGEWKIEGNILSLTSFQDTIKDIKSILIQEKVSNDDSITIVVIDKDNFPLAGATIVGFLNNDIVVKTMINFEGKVKFPKQKLDSIQVKFLGLSTFLYSGECDFLEIRMGQLAPLGFRFKDEKWKIKNGKLLDPRFDGEQNRNKYLKRKTSW